MNNEEINEYIMDMDIYTRPTLKEMMTMPKFSDGNKRILTCLNQDCLVHTFATGICMDRGRPEDNLCPSCVYGGVEA